MVGHLGQRPVLAKMQVHDGPLVLGQERAVTVEESDLPLPGLKGVKGHTLTEYLPGTLGAAMTHTLINLVGTYGLLAILITMAGESCGLPISSEVVVPVGGALAALGHLNFALVVLAATIGNLIGSVVAYWLAARWGKPLLLGPGRMVGISKHHLALAERWFQRRGWLAVFVGRLLPVIRTYISFPAGLARIRFTPFVALTFTGALPWNLGLAFIGYKLGDHYDRITAQLGKAAIVFAVLVVIAVIFWLVKGRSGKDDDEDEKEIQATARRPRV